MEKVKVIPKGTPQGTFGIPSAFDRYEVTHTPDPKPEPVQQAQEPVAQTTPTQPQEPEKKFYQKSLDEGDTKSASIEGLTKLVNHFTKSSGKTEDEVLQQCEDLLGYPKEMIEQYKAQKQQTPDKVSWEDATKKYDETDLYSTIRKKTLEYTKQGLSIEEAKKKALEPFKDVDLEKASKLGVFGRYINDLSKNKGEADIEDNLADTLRVFKTKESADKMLESYGITDQAFKDKVWDIAKKGRFEGSYEYQQLAKKYEGDFTKAPQEEQLKAMKDYVAGLPDRIKNDSFRRFTRGFTSALDGLAVMAKGLSEATTGTAPKWLQDYATENAQENALAKELISQEGTFDLAGIAGQMLSLLPLGRLGIGATALGTIAKGAGVGGVSSALISAGEGKKAEDVQKDLLIGAGVGGALGGLFEGVAKGGKAILDRLKAGTPEAKTLEEKLGSLKILKELEGKGAKFHPVQFMSSRDSIKALSNDLTAKEYKNAIASQFKVLSEDLNKISAKEINTKDALNNFKEIKDTANKLASGFYDTIRADAQKINIDSADLDVIKKGLDKVSDEILSFSSVANVEQAERIAYQPFKALTSKIEKSEKVTAQDLIDLQKTLNYEIRNVSEDSMKVAKSKVQDVINKAIPKELKSKLVKADKEYAKYYNTFKNSESSLIAKGLNESVKTKQSGSLFDVLTNPITKSKNYTGIELLQDLPNLGNKLTDNTRQQLAKGYLEKNSFLKNFDDVVKGSSDTTSFDTSLKQLISQFSNKETFKQLPYYLAKSDKEVGKLKDYYDNLANSANIIFNKLTGGTVIQRAEEGFLERNLRNFLAYVKNKIIFNIDRRYSLDYQIKKTEAELRKLGKTTKSVSKEKTKITPIVTGVTVPNITD